MAFEIRVWDTRDEEGVVFYAVSVQHMAAGKARDAYQAVQACLDAIRKREDERLNWVVDGEPPFRV